MMNKAILFLDRIVLLDKIDVFTRSVSAGDFDMRNTDHRDLFRGLLLAASEVSVMAKPWKMQQLVSE